MSAEANLAKSGIKLPDAPKPVANYVTAVITGHLLFVSGHGPAKDAVWKKGKLGKDLTLEQGREAAREVGINLLSTVRSALGSLDRVSRVVKVLGLVNAVAEFEDHPKVVNGFSDLMVEIFGDRGRHARSAVGAGSLPGNMPVEVEAIFEITG